MKTRTLVSISILVLAVLIIVGSCATMKSPNRMSYEKMWGTWANKNYEPKPGEGSKMAKIIINPDGTYLEYQLLDQTGPTSVGSYTVEKRWTDSKGNTWYHNKVYLSLIDSIRYELSRIDKYNAVLEYSSSNIDYPAEIDPTDWHTIYRIYYRY